MPNLFDMMVVVIGSIVLRVCIKDNTAYLISCCVFGAICGIISGVSNYKNGGKK